MRLLSLLFTALLLPSALPAAPADFSGKWRVDLDASDSTEAILKKLERPWAERKLANKVVVKHAITQRPGEIVINISAPGFSETERLQPDGETRRRNKSLTGPYTTRSFWKEDALVTVNSFRMPDGKPAQMIIRRELKDKGRTLLQTTTLKADETLQARRIWRRVAR